MRLPFGLLVACLIGSPVSEARAQAVAPEVTTLAGPIDLRGALERSSEHGCSQSYATSSARASLQLAIDTRGIATLTSDVEGHETFGPSPGRYAQGDHEVTHTTELARTVLRGRATRSPGSIEIRFDRLDTATVRFTGYGTLPLPPPTPSIVAITLRCTMALVDVLPAQQSDGERPTSMSLLECTFDSGMPGLERFEAPTLVFGHGAGVRGVSQRHMWDLDTARTLRRAP